METKPEAVVLHTMLRVDVEKRLRDFAQKLSTGYGKWDYGVAIQVLLDYYDHHTQQADIQDLNVKMDFLLRSLESDEKTEQIEEDGESVELLNGSRERMRL